ncbi:hypothetical protein EJ08DRAFT_693429 [Tothia fuscella]|uniref:F-box domain-containing protein n=1 Tax=Tothia fuscella TaxID=1048955 RepID=A0A9P4U179_9PEZI|nr:hypothetical protein EJ08DRAFT_693429 [Tothia fuscella]
MAQTSPTTNSSLLSLPTELLIEISTLLPLPALLAFKISTRRLYLDLPHIKPTRAELDRLDTCAKKALFTHLQFDHVRKSCAQCKQWYPNHLFGTTSNVSPNQLAATPDKVLKEGHSFLGGPGMVDLPDDVCAWHQGDLVNVYAFGASIFDIAWHGGRYSYTDAASGSLAEYILRNPGWYSVRDKWCMHCNSFAFDTTWSGSSHCCDTCGVRNVTTYHRSVGEEEMHPSRYVVWKDDGGKMWVREGCSKPMHVVGRRHEVLAAAETANYEWRDVEVQVLDGVLQGR